MHKHTNGKSRVVEVIGKRNKEAYLIKCWPAIIIIVHQISSIWDLDSVPILLTSVLVILLWKSQEDSVSDAAPSGGAFWHDIIL